MATISSPRAQSPNPMHVSSPSINSIGGTPTSSVRTSMELPPGTSSNSNLSTPTIVGPTHQRRNRAALRDYYNIKSKSPTQAHGSSSTDLRRTASNASDSTYASSATLTHSQNEHGSTVLPPQLDDPTFDADKYITELLKTSTLRDILKIESNLVSEIRNLDGERKALVYDNYSKLIKAVGTIGEMQKGMKDEGAGRTGIDGVKNLDGRLEALMKLLDDIKGGKGPVQTSNIEDRKRVRDERRNRDLVKWVLEAPERLERLRQEENAEQAEKEWQRVQELLQKWQGVKGVEEVKQACEKVMVDEDLEEEQSDAEDG